tara:strand:+ start:345 stop:863 length:519 start_codon:yes stop_codon:yes gene_type:complete
MQLKEVEKIMNVFAKFVVDESRKELIKKNKNSTKKLSESLEFRVNRFKDSIDVLFFMEEYGFFQDLGVSGKKVKYNTPYSYSSKMPPSKAFDQWVIRKGLDGVRDKKGKFIPRKSLRYLVARSVFNKGIKPSMFFTKPFQSAFNLLPQELKDAFIFDIEQDKRFFPENMNKN